MTKKLTKVAMTTALAAAAIVPAVVATPAQAAEAEVTFAKAYYSTANGTAAFEADKLAGVISATTDTGITHLEVSNGEVFTMQAFSAYLAVNPTATTDEVLTALSTAGKALSADQVKALDVKEGQVDGGKVTVDPTAVQKTALNEAIAKAEASPKAAELKDAIAAAKAVAEKADATQAEVDAAVKALNEAIAEAEAVKELKVESVKAINATSVEVTFNQEVEALAKADVVVTNKATAAKQYVKSVTLAEDGSSATVELYDALVNKNTYNVTVTVGEETASKEFDYVVGDVAKIEAETTQVGKANPTVKYKVLDANGLDITATTAVTFESDKTIDSNGKLTLANGNSAFVYVVYTDTDGNQIKSDRITVSAEASKAVELLNYTVSSSQVTKADFEKEGYQSVTNVKLGQSGSVYALVKDQFGDTSVVSNAGVEYESLNKAVALVDRNTGAITPLTVGTADIRIKIGDLSVVRPIEVKDEAKVATLSLENNAISISDSVAAGQDVKVTVKDQFGDAVKTAGQTITATKKTGTDLITVNASADTDANGVATINVKPVSGKEGTATVELAIGDVKTTLTVNVVKAGAVDSYVVEGFKKELDVAGDAADSAKLPEKATLEIYAKDANGVKTGAALTSDVTYEVKEGTTLVYGKDTTATGVTLSSGKLTLDSSTESSALKAGKTYTVTAKVGSLEVFKDTFTVKDTSPQPTVEQKKSSVEVNDKAELDFSDFFTVTFSEATNNTYTVKAIEATSDNATVAKEIKADDSASKKVVFTSTADGDATLILKTVTLTISDKDYKVELNNAPINVKVGIIAKKAKAQLQTDAETAISNLTAAASINGTSDLVAEQAKVATAKAAIQAALDGGYTQAQVESFASYANIATTETAIADQAAVNNAITGLTDASVTATDAKAQPTVVINTPVDANGVAFTFTAISDDNATVTINDPATTADVTRNNSAGKPTVTVTATKNGKTATQVYEITVPAGDAGTDAVAITKKA